VHVLIGGIMKCISASSFMFFVDVVLSCLY
jgi:hypothetical protein